MESYIVFIWIPVNPPVRDYANEMSITGIPLEHNFGSYKVAAEELFEYMIKNYPTLSVSLIKETTKRESLDCSNNRK